MLVSVDTNKKREQQGEHSRSEQREDKLCMIARAGATHDGHYQQ